MKQCLAKVLDSSVGVESDAKFLNEMRKEKIGRLVSKMTEKFKVKFK